MKKVYILMLIIFLMISSVSLAYTDTAGHWAEKNIESLSRINIIKGYSDNTFRPDDYITRAELITIVNRLLKNSEQSYKYIPDVLSTDWYSEEVRKGIYSGIVRGNSEGMIRPNDYITREEAVLILGRAFVENMPVYNTFSYEDINEISDWAHPEYYTFIKLGYISGYNDNTVRPKANITRAEIVKIINNIFSEIVFLGEYTEEVHGNLLVSGDEIRLNNVIVNGDLVVTEGTNGKLELNNVAITGNLILRAPVEYDNKKVSIKGKVVNLYSSIDDENANIYRNHEYGIEFAIPENAKVIEITESTKKVDYNQKNLITLRVNKAEGLHFVSFKTGLAKEKKRFELIYNELKTGKIGLAEYAVCADAKKDSYFIYIKRNDIEYALYFYNIDDYNVVDSLVNSIKLYEGELVHEHSMKVYRNPGLYLKFSYLDYVGVDDSYNTGTVFDGDSYFKLFIQVNNVTDMSDYSLEELKMILKTLEGNVEILDTKAKTVYQYDAIEFTTTEDNKMTKSLYVIIETKLYHFIFVGDANKMESIGNEIYNNIVNTIEF
ncbi:MAG: S-layer homology domain-containing protein [Clostridia bacterium]|nr:S-layer homology domain-containing protein [Clostridia bacterium]